MHATAPDLFPVVITKRKQEELQVGRMGQDKEAPARDQERLGGGGEAKHHSNRHRLRKSVQHQLYAWLGLARGGARVVGGLGSSPALSVDRKTQGRKATRLKPWTIGE